MPKVTVDEAARILKCSKANIYQRIKNLNIKTETEIRKIKYTATRSIKKQVFELNDLSK